MKTKTKKPFSKVLAGLLSFALAFTMLPSMAFAEEADPVPLADNDGLELSKTATLENDGTYTIDLEAYATGEYKVVGEKVPLDIVLVLDQSGSMADPFAYQYEETYEKFTGSYWDAYTTPVYHLDEETGEYHLLNVTREWKTGFGVFGYKYTFTCETEGCNWAHGNQCAFAGWEQYPGGSSWQGGTDWGRELFCKTTSNTEVSRLEALQDSVTKFVQSVEADASSEGLNHRIAIVGFASETGYGENTEILTVDGDNTSISNRDSIGVAYSDKTNYAKATGKALVACTDSKVDTAIGALAASGATRADLGMIMAEDILNARTDKTRKSVVIMFTDGTPTKSDKFDPGVANGAITHAKNMKSAGTDVYTVGIFDNTDPDHAWSADMSPENKYMHATSSNYLEATTYKEPGTLNKLGYYCSANNASGLDSVFQNIADKITGSTAVTLDENAVLKDIISDQFDASKAQVSAHLEDYQGNGNWSGSTPVTATLDNNTVSVTGFSYKDHYVAEAVGSQSATGQKVVVRITGVLPTDAAVTNEVIDTNDTIHSGIYANSNELLPVKEFPQPKTILTSKAYVLDYAKPFTMNASDWKQTDTALYGSFETADAVAPKYGSLSGLVYTPTTTKWDGYDNFYAFGTTTDSDVLAASANANGNLWSKVSVIPANNVYYEDDFETNDSGTVGIEYSKDGWSTVTDGSSAGTNTETAKDTVHGGWTNASLADDGTYSDGSAHYAIASDTNRASATFTFTGTGVDIYSQTDMTTGTVLATLKGTNVDVAQALVVDNKAASGQNTYQIPTVSFSNLEYGTYQVTLYVTTAAASDNNRCTYYLDGIRVYNPIQALENDSTVQRAYGDEMYAVFMEVRDRLLDPAEDVGDATVLEYNGAVFIDEVNGEKGVPTNEIATYDSYGPENEVYLAANQKIGFAVPNTTLKYAIGLKAPGGNASANNPVVAKVSDGSNTTEVKITSASDLYYVVKPNDEGLIIIENTSDQLLAVTKLKVSGVDHRGVTEETVITSYSAEAMLAYANIFDTLPVTKDTTDSDASVTEPTTPDESGEVIIDNPEPETKPNNDLATLRNLIKKLFDGFRILLGH